MFEVYVLIPEGVATSFQKRLDDQMLLDFVVGQDKKRDFTKKTEYVWILFNSLEIDLWGKY